MCCCPPALSWRHLAASCTTSHCADAEQQHNCSSSDVKKTATLLQAAQALPWLVQCHWSAARLQKLCLFGVLCCHTAAHAASAALAQLQPWSDTGSTVANVQKKKAAALAMENILAHRTACHCPGPNCPICLVSASRMSNEHQISSPQSPRNGSWFVQEKTIAARCTAVQPAWTAAKASIARRPHAQVAYTG